ncbi:MAG: hypothetical protein OHK0015_25980 [Chloroflexi bacterium OHK40]
MRRTTWQPELLAAGFLLLLALCLWVIAYQFPLHQIIRVGGDLALLRRDDDAPFLLGINGSEPPDRLADPADPGGERQIWWFELLQRTGERPLRWTSAETTLLVPGAGGGSYLVELLARSGRPDGVPTPSVWTAGTLLPLDVSLPAGEPRRYRLLVPADHRGVVRITMRTTPYAAPGDPRELGFVLHEVRLQTAGGGLRAPAWPMLGWLTLTTLVVYGMALAFGAGLGGALALAGGAAAGGAFALAGARPALTLVAPALGLLALGCAAPGAVVWTLTRGPRCAALTPVLGLTLLAFALRMAGMLHPHARFSDLGFNANNLYRVTLGQVFFSAGLPSDAGGGQAPYPPGLYLVLLPGQILAAGDGSRRLLVQGGTALLDSLALLLIWALTRRAGLGQRAALLGAACYLLPTPALEAFSIGEYANLGGQALVLPLLALLGLGLVGEGWRSATTSSVPIPIALVVAVALGLLGHSGVTLSVGALLVAAWALGWAGRLRGRATPIDPARLTFGAAAGLGLALLLYYTAPSMLATLGERAGSTGVAGTPPLRIVADTALALLGLAPPEDRRVALPPLIGPLAIAGALLLARRRAPGAAPVRTLLAAWWLGAALTLALLVVAGQGVRWAIFLYPALCLGAGVALDALWQRGRPGQLAAWAAIAAIIGAGLVTWIVTIRDYIHV